MNDEEHVDAIRSALRAEEDLRQKQKTAKRLTKEAIDRAQEAGLTVEIFTFPRPYDDRPPRARITRKTCTVLVDDGYSKAEAELKAMIDPAALRAEG